MLATMCFVVEECVDSIIKRRAIDIIDNAFTISILSRENFEELFDMLISLLHCTVIGLLAMLPFMQIIWRRKRPLLHLLE